MLDPRCNAATSPILCRQAQSGLRQVPALTCLSATSKSCNLCMHIAAGAAARPAGGLGARAAGGSPGSGPQRRRGRVRPHPGAER